MYGRLHDETSAFTVRTTCANSGKAIQFGIDIQLNATGIEAGSEPMFCVPLVQIMSTKEPSILDIF